MNIFKIVDIYWQMVLLNHCTIPCMTFPGDTQISQSANLVGENSSVFLIAFLFYF